MQFLNNYEYLGIIAGLCACFLSVLVVVGCLPVVAKCFSWLPSQACLQVDVLHLVLIHKKIHYWHLVQVQSIHSHPPSLQHSLVAKWHVGPCPILQGRCRVHAQKLYQCHWAAWWPCMPLQFCILAPLERDTAVAILQPQSTARGCAECCWLAAVASNHGAVGLTPSQGMQHGGHWFISTVMAGRRAPRSCVCTVACSAAELHRVTTQHLCVRRALKDAFAPAAPGQGKKALDASALGGTAQVRSIKERNDGQMLQG